MADLDLDRLAALDSGCSILLVSVVLAALSATPIAMFAFQHSGAWLFSPLVILPTWLSRTAALRLFERPGRWLPCFEWALLGGGCLFLLTMWVGPDVQSPYLAGIVAAIACLFLVATVGHSVVFYARLSQLAHDIGRPALADDFARLRWMKLGSNAALFLLGTCALFALSIRDEEAAVKIACVGAVAWLACAFAWLIECIDVWRLKGAVDTLISR